MRLGALAAALVLVGSITVTFPAGEQSASAQVVEVRMGALASGSTVTGNFTEGTASVAGVLITPLTTNMLYLNNTDATNAWYAKIAAVSTSGLANVVSLTVGLDNGTQTPQ